MRGPISCSIDSRPISRPRCRPARSRGPRRRDRHRVGQPLPLSRARLLPADRRSARRRGSSTPSRVRDLDAAPSRSSKARSSRCCTARTTTSRACFRDFDVRFANVFDTMIAAQLLGREQLGLAALVREFFGVELDKSLTRHDWGVAAARGAAPALPRRRRRPPDRRARAPHRRARGAGPQGGGVDRVRAPARLDRAQDAVRSRGVPVDPRRARARAGRPQHPARALPPARPAGRARRQAAVQGVRKPPAARDRDDGAARLRRAAARDRGFPSTSCGGSGACSSTPSTPASATRRSVPLRMRSKGTRPTEKQLAWVDILKALAPRGFRDGTGARRWRSCPNHLLHRIAELRPTTISSSSPEIPFFGKRRLERYGEQILAGAPARAAVGRTHARPEAG